MEKAQKRGLMKGVDREGLWPALTVHLNEFIQAREDVLQFLQREEAPVCHGLVEEVMEHPQHAHVSCLRHQQLCGPKTRKYH